MADAGRPRKPSALKAIEGNKGKRAGNANEPEFDLVSDLEPPWHLDDGAQEVWREVAFMLRKAKVFTVADKVTLELLCNTVADVRRIRAERNGEFVIKHHKTGTESLSQQLIAEQMLTKRALDLLAKFGMDPSSRSKVMVDPQLGLFGDDPASGTSRFFNK